MAILWSAQRKPAAGSRVRVPAALLILVPALLFSACATPPEPERSSELTELLPAGQTLYLGIRVAQAETLLESAVVAAGVESRRLDNLLDRTEQIVASYGRNADGEPRMFLVGSGRYTPRRTAVLMRLSRRWSRESGERNGERHHYWMDRESGIQVSFPNTETMLIASEDIVGGMVSRDKATDRFLAPPEIVEQFDLGEVSLFMPDPKQWLGTRIGALPFELPIVDLRLELTRSVADRPEDAVERDVVGDIRLRSERDARAFTVVFRLLAAQIAREVGVEQPDLFERLSIDRRDETVRFSGVRLSEQRVGGMVGALLAESAANRHREE